MRAEQCGFKSMITKIRVESFLNPIYIIFLDRKAVTAPLTKHIRCLLIILGLAAHIFLTFFNRLIFCLSISTQNRHISQTSRTI